MEFEGAPGGRALRRGESSVYGALLGHAPGRRQSLEESGDLLAAAKLSTIPNIAIRLSYDQAEFSLGIDLHVFVFDKNGEYLDCLCYRNSQMPGLHFEENCVRFTWMDIPVNCSIFVLSVASYTPGVSLSDLTDAEVTVSTFDPELPARVITIFDISSSGATGPALFYGLLAEDTDKLWKIKRKMVSDEGHTPDLLLAGAKRIAAKFAKDLKEGVAGGMIPILMNTAESGNSDTYPDSDEVGSEGGAQYAGDAGRENSEKLKDRMGKIGARPLELRDSSILARAQDNLRPVDQKPSSSETPSIAGANELLAKLQERRRLVDKSVSSSKILGQIDPHSMPSEVAFGRLGIDRGISGRSFQNIIAQSSSQSPKSNATARSIATLQKDLTNVEVTLRHIEMAMERISINQTPIRDTLDKMQLNNSIFTDEMKTRSAKQEGRLAALESSVESLHKKLDTIIDCFKESGYIS